MSATDERRRELEGRKVFIAGAGRNSGRAISLAFAREGADLVLVARKREGSLQRVADEVRKLGAKAITVLADLTAEDEVQGAVRRAVDELGPIDTLVSVLAIRPHVSVVEMSHEEWCRVFHVNVHATFLLAKALIPSMIEQRFGNIIALGGVSSLRALPNRPSVNASKHALYALIQSIAVDHGAQGIRANLLAPGFIENDRINLEWYPEAVEGTTHTTGQVERTPLRREGRSEEVAEVALFLASDRSAFVTGDSVVCAGGRQL